MTFEEVFIPVEVPIYLAYVYSAALAESAGAKSLVRRTSIEVYPTAFLLV